MILITLSAYPVSAQPALIPEDELGKLEAKYSAMKGVTGAAREKLMLRRLISVTEKLLQENPSSPNRYRVISIQFRSLQRLVKLDKTERNLKSCLEIAKQLASAPDEYAAIRCDADLLVVQSNAARQGADPVAKTEALRPLGMG